MFSTSTRVHGSVWSVRNKIRALENRNHRHLNTLSYSICVETFESDWCEQLLADQDRDSSTVSMGISATPLSNFINALTRRTLNCIELNSREVQNFSFAEDLFFAEVNFNLRPSTQ